MVKQNFLTKMLLLCALIVGSVSSAWGQKTNVSTVTTKFSANGNVTSNFAQTGDYTNATWYLAVTWKDNASWQNMADKGAQIGSGSHPATKIVLTGASVPGTITSVKVNTSVASGGTTTVGVEVGGVTFKCNNANTATLQTSAADYTFTGTSSGDVVLTWNQASTSKAIYIKSITVTYEETSATDPSATLSTTSLDFGKVNFGETKALTFTVTPANLTGDLSLSCNNAKYEVSPTSIASMVTTATTITVTAKPTALNDNMDGTVTISGGGLAANKTVTLTTTVTDPDANDGSSIEKAYTVAEAIAATPASGTSDNVYIKGIVSSFQASDIVSDGSNYRYYISDDGTETNQLLVFKGKGLNNVAFSNAGDLLLGDEVVIYGGLTTYNNTKEVAAGNYIVSLNRKELVSIALSGNYTTTFVEGSEFNHEGVIVTATYNDNSTAVVTADATFSEPDMTQIGQQEVTVTYNGKETSYNITITAIPTHTVTFSINGTETTEDFKEGASIEFPDDPSAIEGKVFVGWVTTPIDGTTDSEPTLVTSAIMGDADIVYYATFATETGTPLVFSKYEKVTTAPADWSGTYLLGATYTGGSNEDNKGTFVFSGFAATYGNREKLTPGTTEYTDYEIVIEKVDEHYTLHHTKSNMYFSYTGSSNNMYSADKVNGDSEKWNIDADGIITNVNITNRMIRYNGSSPRFSCYTQGQTATDLYKRIETGGFEYSGYCTTVPTTSITITPNKEYVSFSSPYPLDFTNTAGLTAYVVSDETATSVTLTEVSKVPANTGLVLKGTAETNYTVPLLSGDAETFTNKLLGTGTDGITGLTSKSVYVLSDGKFKVYTGTEIAGGKAYLPKTSEAPSLSFDFGEGTTGIQNIERTINDNQYYTLDGRRVAEPTKGLYIVNGKKVLVP